MAAARKYSVRGVNFLRRLLPRAADGNLRPLFESRMQWEQSAILLAEGKLVSVETAIRKALAANQSHLNRVTARARHAEAGERRSRRAWAMHLCAVTLRAHVAALE